MTIPAQKIEYQEKKEIRLDKFLSQLFPDVPRRFFQQKIKSGEILVNGNQTKPSLKLKTGDKIKIPKKLETTNFEDLETLPEKNIPFEVASEHEDFLIIEKPAGLSVHPSFHENSGTLVNGLLEKFPEVKDVGEDYLRPGIVHRLDKNTSGLMIIAKNQKAFNFFKSAFQEKKIQKKYLALSWKSKDKNLEEKSGEINLFVGRSKRNPTKQGADKNLERLSNPKEAKTLYNILKERDDKILFELTPKTGRKHQIRVHLHALGFPLVGDQKHKTKLVQEKNKKFNRHFLHASSLKFVYNNKKRYSFKSNPPEIFKKTFGSI